MLHSATPVLRTGDYPRAHRFYTHILGFECAEEAGDPVGFGIFRRDRARVFLEAYQGAEAPYHRWRAYFHVDGVEALAASIVERGGILATEVTETEYGMLEFEIADPDGNVLCFGQDV
ncbi:MAG: VOC family protein [Pseudomonadota bacterium]